ncbi:hypothetical protein [Amycolatopsis sp. H20-H5]|uniref:hypothetical protein n=1 Tax=Amycolatopsis sp. H20-H5 TaxID=3046309 RepID=UPI002DBC864E|nr:hypothetical protein [Amycolatopsis sp. H20-H5]MEC3981707.1 hypothetical protein [Amycolatopsis sp. H20-H5]
MTGVLEQAKAVGDAVLYEGYLLYPYRASAGKNKVRWQWGVLMPPSFASEDRGEYGSSHTECLLEPRSHTRLHVKLRFLQAQARLVHDGERPVDSLTIGDTEYTTWDEAIEREIDVVLPAAELLAQPVETPFTIPGGEETEDLGGGARLVRRTQELTGVLVIRLESLDGPFGGVRLRLDLRNTSSWSVVEPTREQALHHALLAAHLVLSVDSGHFLSMLEPPEWAKPAVEACVNERVWPVLIGDNERSPAILASPIILYDNPAIAAESQGDLFDGTEIDEILTLRTMTLTDEEKRQARATDPRAREIVDRVDAMPQELLDRLHGTVRYLRSVTAKSTVPVLSEATAEADDEAALAALMAPDVPWWDPAADASVSPETDSVVVAGITVAAGSQVILRPGLRRSDAQDMFLAGRIATVRAVLSDVDGDTHIAVTVDDDPAADLQNTHGRFRYFSPDEIEPLEAT